MLGKIIEEIKKTEPDKLESKTGDCRFCGQMVQMEVPADWNTEMIDEAAVEYCDCLKSRIYTGRKKQKEHAEEAIEKQFGHLDIKEFDDSALNMLNNLAAFIVDGKIVDATVNIGYGVKAKLSITKKGFIKIQKSIAITESREV